MYDSVEAASDFGHFRKLETIHSYLMQNISVAKDEAFGVPDCIALLCRKDMDQSWSSERSANTSYIVLYKYFESSKSIVSYKFSE